MLQAECTIYYILLYHSRQSLFGAHCLLWTPHGVWTANINRAKTPEVVGLQVRSLGFYAKNSALPINIGDQRATMSRCWVVNPLSLFLTTIMYISHILGRVNLLFLFLPDTHKVASLSERARADSSKASCMSSDQYPCCRFSTVLCSLLWYIGVYRKRPAGKEPLDTAGRGDMVHVWVDLGH